MDNWNLLCPVGHSPVSLEWTKRYTGGESSAWPRELPGMTTTAPAGIGPPSAVTGNKLSRGDETTVIDRATLSQEGWVCCACAGRSQCDPTTNLVWIDSSLESLTCIRASSPLLESEGFVIDSIPEFKTYTPPPTASARQPTWESSEPPPHLASRLPNPGPKTPIDARCLWMRGTAYSADVCWGEACDKERESKGSWSSAGTWKLELKYSGKDMDMSSSWSSLSCWGLPMWRRNFIKVLFDFILIKSSAKTSSRLLGTRYKHKTLLAVLSPLSTSVEGL